MAETPYRPGALADDARLAALADAYLGQYASKLDACLARLDDAQVWWRPAAGTNSVGNLVLHLRGNLSQWLLAGLGGRAFERRRRDEFLAEGGASCEELRATLAETLAACRQVAAALTPQQLAAPCTVQGYALDGLGVLLHALEHASYHVGQVVLLTKQLLGPQAKLDFYPQHAGE
jgi:uncharacterized damage-inducible protein DinB